MKRAMIKNSQQDEVIAEGPIVPLHYEYVHCGDRINNKGHNVPLKGSIISIKDLIYMKNCVFGNKLFYFMMAVIKTYF